MKKKHNFQIGDLFVSHQNTLYYIVDVDIKWVCIEYYNPHIKTKFSSIYKHTDIQAYLTHKIWKHFPVK
jgi:hypothetical protein